MGKKETIFIWLTDHNSSKRKILSSSVIFLIDESIWEVSWERREWDKFWMLLMFWANRVWWDNLFTWNKAVDRFGKV